MIGKKHTVHNTLRVDVSKYRNVSSFKNRFIRLLWALVWMLLFRPSPRPLHSWRRFLLWLFGARIGKGVHVYPSCRIWGPWNLRLDDYSCLAAHVDCYCVAPISIGAHTTISQYSYLCTATHDYEHPNIPLITAPVVVEDQAWVCADVFVGPGVVIGQGAVVGARATVLKDVESWTVVAGSPARFIKKRIVS